MKNYWMYPIFLISIILLLNIQGISACGYVDFTRPYYNLLDPNLLMDDEYSPVFYTTSRYYNKWFEPEYKQDDNIKEWNTFLGNFFKDEDIAELIYEVDKDTLIKASFGTYNGVNPVLQHLVKNNKKEILDYIAFAKQCEDYCNIDTYWQTKPEDGGEADLIKEGKIGTIKSKSWFIKLRYAFQTVKLLHLYNKLNECIVFYDRFIDVLKVKSIIKYWAMDHKAGALMKVGKRAEGLYLFTRVFAECPSRRYSAYYSFKVDSDREWDEILSLCINNDEKAVLYFLRGINPVSVALEEIENIYELNPQSEYLQILALKEINKLENELLSRDLENANYLFIKKNKGDFKNKQLLDYLIKFKILIDDILNSKKQTNTEFWQIISAYTDFLNSNYKSAGEKLINISSENINYERQINIIKTAITVCSAVKIDDVYENNLIDLLLKSYPFNFTDKDITDLILDFSYYLFDDNQIIKKFFCKKGSYYELRTEINILMIDALLSLIDKEDKTLFEKFLLYFFVKDSNSGREDYVEEDITEISNFSFLKESLLELKGTYYLINDDLENALKIYESLSDDFWSYYNSQNVFIDPFNLFIIDKINYDGFERLTDTITKIDFTKKLLELTDNIKKSKRDAESYFLLGNAYYNITYFGASFNLVSNYRSGSFYSGFTDCSKALYYFKNAVKYTKDKELAAKACYMAAKCQQNIYDLEYNTESYSYDNESYLYKKYNGRLGFPADEEQKENKNYREYFKILNNKYSKTQFYEQIIKECKYFDYYVENF